MMRVQWIACNACGADAFRELGRASEWNIGKCGQCSLVYVNPVPFFEPTRDFSEISLGFEYTRVQREVTPEVLRHDERQLQRQCEHAARLIGRALGPGRFLDVGCGPGSTVRAATKLGWDAMGIDLDPILVEIGRRELRQDLRCGTLPDPGLESGQFQFVRLRDVIEHLPNPREVLIDIARLLAPGGLLLIATPNEGGLPSRVRALAGMPRDLVATVSPPHHLHGFGPATLRRILQASGLESLEIRTTTPIDPAYVPACGMRSARDPLRVPVWETARWIGMGSMLLGWAVKG